MKKTYSSGVAFIFEGDTEQTFYEILISQFSGKHPEYSYSVSFDDVVNEVISESSCGSHSVIIRMNSMKTITQVAHSADWFNNSCKKKHPGIKWTVFLCYDTDSHLADITKFYEGDWLTLRRKLKGKNVEVIDLASRAMIEDLFLYDKEGICNYLEVPDQTIPREGNGKTTLKQFFRKFGKVYHEGERAADMIWGLDMDLIVASAEIQLHLVDERCFPLVSERVFRS
ncbi:MULTISPECIES: hypothetical protein [Sphaerochaeta]|jgi:hypothetical protein|uniref:DUF4276 family protein n=1 Tax=bioreactor metagenome TaxID=1076179 RepID=A0A644YL73_9ZZZZ|nr:MULTISPECIES: hypothetical protein [Sphaerochaeta]MDD3457706.1 hypothetical protein [Sphaerochaeta sp.]MEA5028980.1 hypothetical protein [Sphaerochaeta associata]MEA5108541.1 hypothetical protein [Sphaerochaeta associata]